MNQGNRKNSIESTQERLQISEIEILKKLGEVQRKLLQIDFNREKAFKIILDAGLELINADIGQLLVLEQGKLVTRASTIPDELGYSYDINDSILGLAFKKNEPINVGDLKTEEPYSQLYKTGLSEPMSSELAVPITTNNKVIGVLNAESKETNAFHETQIEIWSILASQITSTLNLAQRISEYEVLQKIRGDILKDIPYEDKLKGILEKTCQLIGAQIGQIVEVTADGRLLITASTLMTDLEKEIEFDTSISGYVISNNVPIKIDDLSKSEYGSKHVWFATETGNMQSELMVPLSINNAVIGALNVESPEINSFSDDDLNTLLNIAEEVAFLLFQTRQERMQSLRLNFQEALFKRPEVFNTEETYQAILDASIELLGAETASLMLKNKNILNVVSSTQANINIDWVSQRRQYDVDNCIGGLAVKQQKIINVQNININPIYSNLYKAPDVSRRMISNIAAPLFRNESVIGVLNLESIREGAFSADDEVILAELAQYASYAIDRALMIKEAQEREGSQAEERLASEMLHRLNQPFGAVRIWAKRADRRFTELNLDPAVYDTTRLKKALDQVVANAERAMNLAEELRWSWQNIESSLIEIDEYLDGFLTTYNSKRETSSQIHIYSSFNASNIFIRANELLERVFENLIDNATRILSENNVNEPRIEFSTEIENSKVRICVADNGPGIPSDKLEDVFQQGYTTRIVDEPFHGIGLWWSRRYLKDFDSKIFVESKKGEGAKFIVEMPIVTNLPPQGFVESLLAEG